MTSDATLRWGLELAYKRDRFAAVRPEMWAKTHTRELADINRLMDCVRRHYEQKQDPAPIIPYQDEQMGSEA
jgi:hypothetical protein